MQNDDTKVGQMCKIDAEVDEVAAGMIASLDALICEFESRHWLKAAALGEELVCEIYDRLGMAMPEDRAAKIEASLGQAQTKTPST